MFESDQEPSILDLKKGKVVAELGVSHDVIMEVSPVHEHQSKGVFKRAAQTVGGLIRAHELKPEQSYSKELEADHVVVPWLIMHAAAAVSLFEFCRRGEDSVRGFPWQAVPTATTHLRRVASSIFPWTGPEVRRPKLVAKFFNVCILV